jgi:endonuclease/exonuclease/phosphatase family metal-dependent hydrolase
MQISVKNILAWIVIAGALVCILILSLHFLHNRSKISSRQSTTVFSDTIPLGFYNVENLFDLNYDGNEYPEYRPGALGWNQQMFDKKIDNISAAIAALKVDILGLCEIENRTALEALRSALAKRGCAYPFFAIADFVEKGSTCPVLLSKYPILLSRDLRAQGEGRGGRSILEADVDCGRNDTLKVFVNHWPSKSHPESERLAMASALENRLKTVGAYRDYVIIGDLNTDYDEWSKFHASGLDDTKGVVGLNHVLRTIHGIPGSFQAYVGTREMCRSDSLMHYDPWLEIPEAKRFSRMYRKEFETPDHILLPRSMFDAIGLSYCKNTFGPFSWNDTLMKNGEPFRWQMRGFGKRRFHAGEGYSDHLPLRVLLIRKPWQCDSTAAMPPVEKAIVKNNGFELSTEGWTGGSGETEVSRDSLLPFSGRYCLRLKGSPGKNNIIAGRTVLHREENNLSRAMQISFAIRGDGKLSIRARSLAGKGKESSQWQYYKGEAFAHSGSSRFLPVKFKSWKKVVLTYTAESAATSDVELEVRAGKESPFCFYLDEVRIQ